MSADIVLPPEGAATRVQPPISEAAVPFWDATRECRLVIQRCNDCGRSIHYPREACPTCLSTDLAFADAAGTGTVHACSTMPAPGNAGMAGRGEYVVALVDLPEGVRMMANLVGPGALEAAVGDAVEVVWEPLEDGRHLPLFRPV